MRANPAEFSLVAPESLGAVLSLLANDPGRWTPMAGGTDLMVLYSAGKLAARNLVSLWNLPELSRIEVTPHEVRIGAACTYTALREHATLSQEFPLLVRAAAWTGSMANQNRGTLGGNIVNASPAADSLPALLVYEADLILTSLRGERRILYSTFHTGYKQTLLAPDELVRAICLPRRYAGYIPYSRKVGARNAQAISKVCVAGLGKVSRKDGAVWIEDVRMGAGAVAPVPLRLRRTEDTLRGQAIGAGSIQVARRTAIAEIRPIDDIRSTAAYRAAVLGNLVEEFLRSLTETDQSDAILARWNQLPADTAVVQLLSICGSEAWARQLAWRRPFASEASLVAASDEIWLGLTPRDWEQAFSCHPRIGERKAPGAASTQSASWSVQEQSGVNQSESEVGAALATENLRYEQRFGRTFIVCASGKSAAEMLEILRGRMQNDDDFELHEAAEQQRQITNLRFKKWLNSHETL